MRYLKLRRTQAILLCFALSVLLFAAFPVIDISVSTLFFRAGYFQSRSWGQVFMHEGMAYFLALSLGSVVALYAFNRLFKRNLFGIDLKRVVYVSLVLVLGAGVIVNMVFKDNFGRARPRDIAEFGGSKQYSPPFVITYECDKNCSFSSGEAAGGFFSLALALALSKRRRVFMAAIGFGVVVSACRIATGAHFLSDTVVSFFVMLICADALFYFIVLTERERAAQLALGNILGAKT